jgi:catechol-2,3-dioxygenase
MAETSIPAETRIGHVHLKVADLERAIGFYRDYLGFDLLFTFESAAFLSAGGYHHHIGLNTWESKDGSHLFLARLACIISPSTTRRGIRSRRGAQTLA